MDKYFKLLIGLAIVPIFVSSCAQQIAPTGGDKDEVPPKILTSNPLNESVGMLRNEIMLEFDEYVSLKGASQELIVSPPLKYPVDFRLKNKKLYVSWKDTLRDNATYLLQFGQGIVDVNEGNPLDSNVYVFSTGPYIDSFSIQGQVINAFDLKPMADVWVMLYEQDIDTLPYSTLPRYFAKSDKTGKFDLQYLSDGDYKIFGLVSLNGGYFYDVQDETIGFLTGMLPATYSKDTLDTSYTIKMFVEDDSTQYLKSFVQEGNKGLVLEFNRAVGEITITDLIGNENVGAWSEQWSSDLDSFTYWFPEPNDYDSLKLRIEVDDFIDTLFLRKPAVKKPKAKKGGQKKGGGDKPQGALSLNPSAKGKQPYFKSWKLQSKTPIESVTGMDKGLFIEDSDTSRLEGLITKEYYDLVIKYPWKQGTKYKVIIPDSTIIDRYGESNSDSLTFTFVSSQKEDYGQLYLKHKLPENGHSYIWQLLNDKKDVMDERLVEPSGEITYTNLQTGKYSIRILFDENDNGIWDTGYYKGKRQPEKVKYYDQPIDIRSNWATELEWILTKLGH